MNQFSESSPNSLIVFCCVALIYLIGWVAAREFKSRYKNRKNEK